MKVGKFLWAFQFRFFIQSFLDLPTPIGKSIFHSIEILSSFYLFSNCNCESKNIIFSIISFTVIRCQKFKKKKTTYKHSNYEHLPIHFFKHEDLTINKNLYYLITFFVIFFPIHIRFICYIYLAFFLFRLLYNVYRFYTPNPIFYKSNSALFVSNSTIFIFWILFINDWIWFSKKLNLIYKKLNFECDIYINLYSRI